MLSTGPGSASLTSRSAGCTETHHALSPFNSMFSAPHVGRYLCCITQGISLKQTAFSLKHRIWSSSNADTSDENKKQPKQPPNTKQNRNNDLKIKDSRRGTQVGNRFCYHCKYSR